MVVKRGIETLAPFPVERAMPKPRAMPVRRRLADERHPLRHAIFQEGYHRGAVRNVLSGVREHYAHKRRRVDRI